MSVNTRQMALDFAIRGANSTTDLNAIGSSPNRNVSNTDEILKRAEAYHQFLTKDGSTE